MADGLTTARPERERPRRPVRVRLLVQYRMVPWWFRVTIVYVLARIVTFGLLAAFARVQTQNSFTLASPRYLDFATIWDGRWYALIAQTGYPATLPIGTDGAVTENAWAFMPAYPFLVRGLMEATGAGYAVVAVTVSVLFGWAAALLFRRLVGRFLPEGTATFATVLFCVAPVSTMFQVAYAESMGVFLLTLALWLLVTRRFWWMLPVVVVLGFTRPTGLAIALMMVGYLVLRFVRRSAADPLSLRAAIPPAVVAVVAGLVGLAWPTIAWAVTGVPKAYTDTELAWRQSYIGRHELVPFAPWIQGFDWWFHEPAGGVLLVLVLAGFAGFLLMPAARAIGPELRVWSASYFVYLLAVFFPQSSTWRILMPLFPMLAIVARPRWVTYRVAVVAVSIALQVAWMYSCWWINGYDWTPP
ncbi:mannosyltransferase family protein [Curtobacterium sp. MCBD17_035]|uniref:mannosyltransferase family protein n=1 Tax=Curtobacterium sp. MCBD17_035 TaxID=2175673 RepID=UPI000DA8553C|nr:mannosyltransferase family protein [Curtobacterium sp. MCBD17_035]WIB66703.1 mannosyltransferase family protein [Curtobacterium sp. MCBD17_035]